MASIGFKLGRVALAASLLALAAPGARAHGDVQCRAYPKSEWRSHNELNAKLVKDGWQIRRMEVTPTCYEVYGKDPQGKRVEAFFDVKTFERVEEDVKDNPNVSSSLRGTPGVGGRTGY